MKRLLIPLIVLVLAVAVSSVAYVVTRPTNPMALAELSVDNLTCGSCVGNVEDSLSQLDGVGQIDVNVTLGEARIAFDPDQISAEMIARRISASDYPARVEQVLSAEDYVAQRRENSQMADRYVGRIGEKLISRDDFREKVESRSAPSDMTGTWNSLVQQQLLLQDAVRNGIVVQEEEVQAEIDDLRNQHEGFDAFVSERYGSLEAFADSTRRNMIINRNIEQNVVAGRTDPVEKRQKLNTWFRQLKEETPVTIFDSKLEAALAAGRGGCGGGCCG
ncbi:MAG: heavy metal-associated domain-containing protein [Desulfuromonadales bacterium]